ncbi:MAG: DUF5789 family protein [Halobacteriaceae archaeon]
MSEDESEDTEPAVALGEPTPVEGVPLARIAARLHWGMAKSEIVDREGETVIRTPDGPQALESILSRVDVPYFESRREFVDAVRDTIGVGPVPTAETDDETVAEPDTSEE